MGGVRERGGGGGGRVEGELDHGREGAHAFDAQTLRRLSVSRTDVCSTMSEEWQAITVVTGTGEGRSGDSRRAWTSSSSACSWRGTAGCAAEPQAPQHPARRRAAPRLDHRAPARHRRLHGPAAPALAVQPFRSPPARARRELLPLHRQHAATRGRAVGDEPATAAALEDLAVAARGHRGDRGRPLLAARRARLPGHFPRPVPEPLEGPHRAGWVDDHAGARAESLHRQPATDAVAQGQGGLPRHEVLREGTRKQILADYLNEVFYGRHAYGAQAAARTYFSKPASRLTLVQAALLAGLPQAPTVYDPLRNPHAALARRNQVLHAMWKNHYISKSKLRSATRRKLQLRPGHLYSELHQPNFFGWATQQLGSRLGHRRMELGGLRVKTTLNMRLQGLALHAVSSVLRTPTDPARRSCPSTRRPVP